MPDQMYKARLRDRDTFYCPNGHGQHFLGETEAEKLKKLVADLREDVAYWKGRTRSAEQAHEHALRVAWGYKGAMRKAQREAGIIPIDDSEAA
jgi:hypothetical protein